jgi:hypothetical protein
MLKSFFKGGAVEKIFVIGDATFTASGYAKLGVILACCGGDYDKG